MDRSRRLTWAGVAIVAFVSAVAVTIVAVALPSDGGGDDAAPSVEITAPPLAVPNPNEVYDPVAAGEQLPRGYRPLLPRDGIEPVYEPSFVAPGDVDWTPDTLVIGVAGETVSKAYPVTHLNQREMVIDSMEGIPILVTW